MPVRADAPAGRLYGGGILCGMFGSPTHGRVGYNRVVDRYSFDVHLTPGARGLLRPGEALVIDWHRLSVCCAGAGEMSLYATGEEDARRRRGLVRLKGGDPIYAARAIFPHLAGRGVRLDGRRTLGFRRFTSNLPRDFGLRAVMGRLPEPGKTIP